MISRSLKFFIILSILATLFLGLKLLTVITVYPDAPVVMLIVRTEPGFKSFMLPDKDFYNKKRTILILDENELLIETPYFFAVNYLWWIFYVLAFLCLIYEKYKKKKRL